MSRTYLRIILDTLFPPTTHERLLRDVTPAHFSEHYQPTRIKDVIVLAPYTSRSVQAAVAACKFEKNQHAATLLATLIAKWLVTHPVALTIIIPLPLSRARERERGFNQVLRVLEHIPSQYTVDIKTNWLIRTRDTARQTSLGRKDRLQNMNDAFTVSTYIAFVDWNQVNRIIICDDVVTTGATLAAAHTALAAHVPKHVPIVCLAWAH